MLKRIHNAILLGLLSIGSLHAQVVVESELPVTITSGLSVNIQGPAIFESVLTNEGIISFDDSIAVSAYNGSGVLSAIGTDQELNFNTNVIGTLSLTGGNKTLVSDVTVGDLILDAAQLTTDGNQLETTGEISGFGETAYIVGALVRSGSDSLVFPIYNGSVYTPVVVKNISGQSPAIRIEGFSQDPLASAGNGLLGVSNNRYWEVSEASGSLDEMIVKLPVINESVAPEALDLTVAYGTNTGGSFRSLGTGVVTGNLSEGVVEASESSGTGFYAVGRYFNEQLRESDSSALVSIYTNTNGADWINSSGWLSDELDTWDRVTLIDKRVAELNLSTNNLTSEFPRIDSGLEDLTSLNLQDNELTSVGDLSNLVALEALDVSNNRLQFGVLTGVAEEHPEFTYAPQKPVLNRVRTLEQIGSVYTVNRTVTGSNNVYSWKKNDSDISQTSSSFDVTINDFSADGSYVAQVTNTSLPDLTLTTTPVILRVSSTERDSASLLAIYDAIIDENSTISNWKESPMSAWTEVSIDNSRVTGLNLDGLSLSGEIPEDLLDIQSLETANFSDNDIDGLPVLVGSLPNLTDLNLSQNRLTFEDLESNVAFTPLNYANQKRFGQSIRDTLRAGSAKELMKQVGGSQNAYQWYLTNDLATDSVLNGATEKILVIDSLTYGNMGRYELRVANSLVPDLILKSQYHRVVAVANLDFTALDLADQPFIAGEAYALRVTAPGSPYDTIQAVRGAGSGFGFNDLVIGDYLVAVNPDDLEEFFPTYYPSTDLWTEAEEFILRVDSEDTLNMGQIPNEPVDPEGATVNGTVESDFEDEEIGGEDERINARRKVKRAGCSVRRFVPRGRTGQEEEDGDYVLYAYVQSDDEGRFEFTGLEDGKYRFNIEYPGIPMDPESYVEFTVGEGGVEDEVLVLEATVTEEGIVVQKIERLGFYRKYFKDLNVYPNPANNVLNIAYSKLMSSTVQVRLVDLQGNVLKEHAIVKGFNQELDFDVSVISDGIYLLNFVDTSLGSEMITTFKVYVRHK